MHRSVIAVVLCIFANVAGAQCLANAPTASPATANPQQRLDVMKLSALAVPAMPVVGRPGGELITAAAAGTHDAPGAKRESATIIRAADDKPGDEEPKPRGGAAMLLAALALMSGIALRRYSSNGQ